VHSDISRGTAAAALSSLTVLSELQDVTWHQSQQSRESNVQELLGSLAQLTQPTSLALGYNVEAKCTAPLSALITVPSKMVKLQSFEAAYVPQYTVGDDSQEGPFNLEANSVWDYLGTADLHQLLTSNLALTTLAFDGLVLDQAGLDLLLAHPHIVKVTLLAIAATESRVDSPCSWQMLRLSYQVDVRTVAFVPLHSLTQPLQVGSLLLPPDVAPEQLPHLLQAATTRMAAHQHLFSLRHAAMLAIEDLSVDLPPPTPGAAPAARRWAPDVCSAVLQAVVRLAVYESVTGGREIHPVSYIFNAVTLGSLGPM
jgi:hypothetical protein